MRGGGLVWGVGGGGEVGGEGGEDVGGEGGEGGGWRLQKSYWQKAVINKWVLSLDLNRWRVEEFLIPPSCIKKHVFFKTLTLKTEIKNPYGKP